MSEQPERCGAMAVFWPDVEAIEAECIRPAGHGGIIHEDEILGEWSEDELTTFYPERPDVLPVRPGEETTT